MRYQQENQSLWRRGFLGLVAIAIILTTSGVSSVFAASSGGIGGRPANPDPDNPRTQSIFLYTIKGGETKTDQIFLSNGSDESQTVLIYAVDGVVTNTGSYTCEQESEVRDDIGSWITMAQGEVTLPAKGTMNLDFTVAIPKDASVGEHNGCIAIQRKDDKGEVSGNLRIHTRQAVRIAAIVPGAIHRKVEVASFSATATAKGQDYAVTLKNTGNVSADVDLKVRLKDVFGNEVYTNGGQQPVIANKSLQLNYQGEMRPFFGGWYIAQADIAYDKRAGIYGTTDNGQLLRAESQKLVVFIWPSVWFFVILGGLLVAGIGLLVWRRRGAVAAKQQAKRALKKHAEPLMWAPYEVKQGDTLELLARKYSVSLDKLAQLNKLSAPYTLTPGQRIYVPQNKQ